MVWKDKLFWALAAAGLASYLLAVLVDLKFVAVGSLLWLLALVYLLLGSVKRWIRDIKCEEKSS